MFKCECHNKEFINEQKFKNHLKYEKERESQKIYTLKNKERKNKNATKWNNENKQHLKEYYIDHREHVLKVKKDYDEKHKLEKQQYMKEFHEKNPLHSKTYYKDNREEVLERVSKYQKTFEGKMTMKASHHKRRVILSTGKHSELNKKTVQEVYEDNIRENGTLTCCLCFKPVKFGEDSLEHYIPVSRSSEFPDVDLNAKKNLGIAHSSCNTQKYDRTLDEWYSLFFKI